MEFKDLKKLCVAAFGAAKNAPLAYSEGSEQYSAADVSKAVAKEFRELTGYIEGQGCDYYTFKRNEITIYELISQTISEVLPPRIEAQYAQFADVQRINQGDKAVFKIKVTDAAKRRARKFVTQVGLAGRYETFELDGTAFEVKTNAIGAAARIGFEEFLDGRWEFSEFTSLMMEGIDEYIYNEIIQALETLVAQIPHSNKHAHNGFDEESFDDILSVVDTYGKATIFCTQAFANKMIPSDARWASNGMKERIWENGWLGDYKGHTVIILEQSFTGTDNMTYVVDPQLAYMIPSGATKPIKIVFEGQSQVRNVTDNDDWSSDLQTYTKVGIATIADLEGTHFIGAYKNLALAKNRYDYTTANAAYFNAEQNTTATHVDA